MGEHALTMSDDSLEQHIVTLFEKLECLRSNSHGDGAMPVSGKMPAKMEVRTLSLWKAVMAECAASFLYVFVVCGAAGGAGVGASASALLFATALASGCAIATLTLCFAKISGAHVSPGVTVAMCVRRRVTPLRTALYIAAQCGGAIAGAAAVCGVGVPGYSGSLSAALPVGGAAWERLGAELVLSAMITAAYCAAMERRYTGAAPALLGAAYCGASLVSMPSLNPARSLGPSFVLSRWDSHWVYWVGGLGGGIACALLLEWGTRRPRPDLSRASSPRDLDHIDRLDKPFHYRHAPTYCAASAPRPDNTEPLYSGTKSLYCRSPPPARHTLHRSQSVYSKGSSATGTAAGGSLVAAQSLLLRPHAAPLSAHAVLNSHTAHNAHNTHNVHHAQNQNAHNAQREPAYGTTSNGVRPGPTGAAVSERRESVYSTSGAGSMTAGSVSGGGARRGPLPSDDSAYGSGTYRAYRHPHTPPEHY